MFELVDESVATAKGQKILGTQWVFDLKRKFDGSIKRFKARFVVRGDHQKPGIDFGEKNYAVVRGTTLRTRLSLAANQTLLLHYVDVVQAFLCGILDETVLSGLRRASTALLVWSGD